MFIAWCLGIGIPFVDNNIESPNALGFTWQFLLTSIVGDQSLYWTHRLFHTPWLYKNYHIKHHQGYRYTFAAIHHLFEDFESLVLAIGGIFTIHRYHFSVQSWS